MPPGRRWRVVAASCLIYGMVAEAPAQPAGADPCREAIAAVEPGSGLPPGLLEAIALVESGRRDPRGGVSPWPWASNAAGIGRFHATREDAVAAVAALRAQGLRSVDVGCMQVNLHHHPTAFASLEDAFDPLSNVRYAAGFLADLHRRAGGDWSRAIGWYHSATPERAAAYRARVLAGFDRPGESAPPGGVVVHRPQAFARLAAGPAWWAPAALPAPALPARLAAPAVVVPGPSSVAAVPPPAPHAAAPPPARPSPAGAAAGARLPVVIVPGGAGQGRPAIGHQ